MGDQQTNILLRMKQVKEHDNKLSDDLIIQEILTKLPIKSILRFESVSKHWHSKLSSSKFAISHLTKSPFYHPSAPVQNLFIRCGVNFYIFSYDDRRPSDNSEYNLVKLDFDYGVVNHPLQFANCCNGLICLTTSSEEYFILWNPATRKLHKYESQGYFKGFNMVRPFSARGFGYSSSDDDYKYVTIFASFSGKDYISAHVFSLRENKWRKVNIVPHLSTIFGHGILVDEKLYWCGFNKESEKVIVSFDLSSEKFNLFVYPSSEEYILGVMGERLCKFTCDKLDILQPPTILRSVSLPRNLRLDCFSDVVGHTRVKFFTTRPFNVGGQGGLKRTLGLVDIGGQTPQYTTLLKLELPSNIAAYVPSMVSPFPLA